MVKRHFQYSLLDITKKKVQKGSFKSDWKCQGDPISFSENIKRNVGGISIRLQLTKKLKNLRRNVGGIRAHFFR